MDLCRHIWSPWRPVPDITDMLVRHCPKCGARDLRVLPPAARLLDTRWAEGVETDYEEMGNGE